MTLEELIDTYIEPAHADLRWFVNKLPLFAERRAAAQSADLLREAVTRLKREGLS